MSETLVEKLSAADQLRSAYSSLLPSLLMATPGIMERVDSMNASLVSGNWTSARHHAATCRLLAHNLQRNIQDNARREDAIIVAVRDLAIPLQQAFDALPGDLDPGGLVDDAAALARAGGPDVPDNLEEILHAVLEDGTNEVERVFAAYELRRYEPLRKQLSYVAILGKIRALWVRHLADLNSVVKALPILAKGVPLFNDAIFAQHRASIADFQTRMRDAQRSLHDTTSTEQLLEHADALSEQLEHGLSELAQTQALLYVAGHALRRLGKGGLSEKVGVSAASAGMLAREAISSVAAAQRIASRLGSGYQDKAVDELLAMSGEKPFDGGKFPDGKNTQIHHLDNTADGAFIEVAGYVQAVQSGRIGGDAKLVSRARLKDPSSGASATVTALFTNFRHIGLTGGCYVIAHGVFRHASAFAADKPAVEIGRLSLQTLAESSWRIAFLELSSPWFQIWRNGQNMRWSWGLHRPGNSNDGLGPEGASEPVFAPFMRGN